MSEPSSVAERPQPISAQRLPTLTADTLAALHFGEGCQLEEYLYLRSLAMLLQPAEILEIGTSCGVGGLMMLDGASSFGRAARLTTIDLQAKPSFDDNLALFPHLRDHIERVVRSSNEALPELRAQRRRFDLVFVDGDHSPAQARQDWQNVEPLADRFILHDTHQMPGCRKLVEAIRATHRYDVLPFLYPLGHQVFQGQEAGHLHGVFHQSKLPWTQAKQTHGPGMTLVQRRSC